MKGLFVFALVGAALAFPSAQQPDVVDLGYAKYLGNRTYTNAVAYLGIPYAEPPLGELRFRAPLPLNTKRVEDENQGKTVNATAYPAFCIQGSTGGRDAGGAGSEDCLKVNVYTPAGAKKRSKLPVLVYIHGGGYIYGNPGNWPFDHWIHQSPNVVIVSVYYRLDAFGFLAAPSFTSTNSPSSIGTFNAGLLDQREALRWVQRNIASFGGDPARVTINGQSAGGASIVYHLVSRGAASERLFSSAIAQSVYRTPAPTPEEMKTLFENVTTATGCASSTDAAAMSCLRKASVTAIAQAQDAAYYNNTNPYTVFHPVLDGKDLTEYPTDSLLGGRFKDVPLIIGSTSNETLSGGSNVTASLKKFFPRMRLQDVQAIEAAYPDAGYESVKQRANVITGESELICARSIMGSAWAKKKSKVFAYRYDQGVRGTANVYHSSENWMMFLGTSTGTNGTTTFEPQSALDNKFSSELIAYWLSFVRSGDPNTYRLASAPKWTPYACGGGAPSRARIVLREPAQNSTVASGSYVETEPNEETKRCAVVASLATWQET